MSDGLFALLRDPTVGPAIWAGVPTAIGAVMVWLAKRGGNANVEAAQALKYLTAAQKTQFDTLFKQIAALRDELDEARELTSEWMHKARQAEDQVLALRKEIHALRGELQRLQPRGSA